VGAAALLVAAVVAGCDPDAAEGDAQTPTSAAGPENGQTPMVEPAGESGVSDYRILFGQSAACRGPSQALGLHMRLGILSPFQEVNDQGGVHGLRVDLTWRDDSYEPEAAATNTLDLINEQEVFALIGAVGTPTSRSATPVAKAAGVPYIGPFTGAEFLRDATTLDNVINMRASYYQETEEMVNRLTTDLGVTRIAVLYQDDSYGLAGFNGVRLALERRGMEMAALGIYTRNRRRRRVRHHGGPLRNRRFRAGGQGLSPCAREPGYERSARIRCLRGLSGGTVGDCRARALRPRGEPRLPVRELSQRRALRHRGISPALRRR